jgi:hypothetical protein
LDLNLTFLLGFVVDYLNWDAEYFDSKQQNSQNHGVSQRDAHFAEDSLIDLEL